MLRAHAKKEACWRAAQVLREAQGQGWDLTILYPKPGDADQVMTALNELIAELERRGSWTPASPQPPTGG